MDEIKELKKQLRTAKLDREYHLKNFEYHTLQVVLLEEAIKEIDR